MPYYTMLEILYYQKNKKQYTRKERKCIRCELKSQLDKVTEETKVDL